MRVDGGEGYGDWFGGREVGGPGANFDVGSERTYPIGIPRHDTARSDAARSDPPDDDLTTAFDRAELERTGLERTGLERDGSERDGSERAGTERAGTERGGFDRARAPLDRLDAQRSSHERAARAARLEAELGELATRAGDGDRAALDRLLELIRPAVVRYCRARLGNGGGVATPEDVAQDVLLAVCGALPRYRSGETATMAFVYGIARNKVVDAFRSAGRDRSEPTDLIPDSADDGPGPDIAAVLSTEVAELRVLLDQLSESQREILVLRIAMGYSAEETAKAVGSTPGAVRVTQHRALSKLRALVSDRHVDH